MSDDSFVQLSGSQRGPLADVEPAGAIDGSERIELTIVTRRRAELPLDAAGVPVRLTRRGTSAQLRSRPGRPRARCRHAVRSRPRGHRPGRGLAPGHRGGHGLGAGGHLRCGAVHGHEPVSGRIGAGGAPVPRGHPADTGRARRHRGCRGGPRQPPAVPVHGQARRPRRGRDLLHAAPGGARSISSRPEPTAPGRR